MTRTNMLAALALVAVGGIGAVSAASAAPISTASTRPMAAQDLATPVHYRGPYRYYGRPYVRPFGVYAYRAPIYVAPSRCGWLRVKARETGSRYWRSRYNACLAD